MALPDEMLGGLAAEVEPVRGLASIILSIVLGLDGDLVVTVVASIVCRKIGLTSLLRSRLLVVAACLPGWSPEPLGQGLSCSPGCVEVGVVHCCRLEQGPWQWGKNLMPMCLAR